MRVNALIVLVSVSAIFAAPALGADEGRRPPAPGAERSLPHGDRDHDRVDDAFAVRLAAAGAGDRVDVVVTGVSARDASRRVGGFRVRHVLGSIDGFSARMTAGQARALARTPGVRRVEAVTRVHALDDGTHRDFGATAARTDRPGLDGSGIGICVVDTGIDPAHEQIAPRTVVFRDFIGSATTAYDDQGHGTHVASIAAGDGTGSTGAEAAVGMAPAAHLYAAKVLDATGYGENDGVAAGLEWCATQPGVRVISMSLGDDAGGDGTDAVSLAVNAAVAGGDVVVVAAGNGGDDQRTIAAPGTATGALTVGSVSEHSNPAGSQQRDDGIWLAPYSSRGPTVDGRTKPDVVAPGHTVRAARAGTAAGYVVHSGTSMATPFVSGAVALALEARPSATPADVRAAVTGTALDVGATGTDNEWGAGLVDVRALVDAVAGVAPRRTPMPRFRRVGGTVPDHGHVDVPIVVPADGLGVPIAVTVTLDGEGGCVIIFGSCWPVEWSPDLDAHLRDPSGTVVAVSECALSGVACGYGRQETIGFRPGVAGTWTLRVYTFEGGPDDGAGGAFVADIATGPLSGGASPPPPPPVNAPPVARAGADQVVVLKKGKNAKVTLDGSASSDPDGDPLTHRWTLGTSLVGSSAVVTVSRPVGTWTFRLTVSDGRGGTAYDDVVVTVRR